MIHMTIEDLSAHIGVPQTFVIELCEAQIVSVGPPITEQTVERIRVSWNLHEELGVNLAGIEVALHLLELIEADRRHMVERLR